MNWRDYYVRWLVMWFLCFICYAVAYSAIRATF